MQNSDSPGNNKNNQDDVTFLTRISHDIRTPLNGLLGMLDLLLESKLTPDQEDLARNAYQSARTLSHAIQGSLGDAAGEPVEMTGPSSGIHELPSTRNLRVLLAEDNLINRKLAVRLLEKCGHHVTVAKNGEEAVSIFGSHEFDIVLMDIEMPIMDGEQAVQLIRQSSERGKTVPIIALTANALPGDQERYLRGGMNGYISKPVNRPALMLALQDLAA